MKRWPGVEAWEVGDVEELGFVVVEDQADALRGGAANPPTGAMSPAVGPERDNSARSGGLSEMSLPSSEGVGGLFADEQERLLAGVVVEDALEEGERRSAATRDLLLEAVTDDELKAEFLALPESERDEWIAAKMAALED